MRDHEIAHLPGRLPGVGDGDSVKKCVKGNPLARQGFGGLNS